MFLEINEIGAEGLTLDRRLELADLEGQSGEPLPVRDLRIRARLTRGARGVDCVGRLDCVAGLSCSRCLGRFEREVGTEFFLTIVSHEDRTAGEAEMSAEDARFLYAPQGRLDLRELAVEQIYLDLPLKPVCQEQCQGLCPSCGANRNEQSCDCRADNLDPRLAPLLRLKS